MIISVRVSDMIESYKKYLETKLGVEFSQQQGFIKEGDSEKPVNEDYGSVRFGTSADKIPWLK